MTKNEMMDLINGLNQNQVTEFMGLLTNEKNFLWITYLTKEGLIDEIMEEFINEYTEGEEVTLDLSWSDVVKYIDGYSEEKLARDLHHFYTGGCEYDTLVNCIGLDWDRFVKDHRAIIDRDKQLTQLLGKDFEKSVKIQEVEKYYDDMILPPLNIFFWDNKKMCEMRNSSNEEDVFVFIPSDWKYQSYSDYQKGDE